MVKLKCPKGYLSNLPGFLRVMEALVFFVVHSFNRVIFVVVDGFFHGLGTSYKPGAMIWCILVYIVCFIITVVFMVLNIIKLLNILCCALDKLQLISDVVAVLLYLSATIVWALYCYKYDSSNCPPNCHYC
ncbi:hypothetical protein AAFF_G00405770 [Aldrovandia affinis]|uniref:MARVEL domain-containing protein n=1 Tax=Aldrovandia affinis TaxID=143900 RepID=A0AAD7SCK4_9TELE|nr:hypothetical protein AAFF_G00405770 [Aldrovandia affinis]